MKSTNIHEIFSKIEHRMTVGTDPENIQIKLPIHKISKMQLFITFFNSCAWINRFNVLFCYRIATSYERANYGIFIEVAKIGDQAITKTKNKKA